MFPPGILGFECLVTVLTQVARVGDVPSLDVVVKVGLLARLVGALDTVPHISIFGHFGVYFSFNIYNSANRVIYLLHLTSLRMHSEGRS